MRAPGGGHRVGELLGIPRRQVPETVEMRFWKTARAAGDTREFANKLFEGAVAQAETSDKLVTELSENWKLDRLAVPDC